MLKGVYELNITEGESALIETLESESAAKKIIYASNNYYTAQEVANKTIKYYHKENVNVEHKYISDTIPYCSHLILEGIYEDDRGCLLDFSLCNINGDRLNGYKSHYLLLVNKATKDDNNFIMTEDIKAFAGFPTFMDILKYYRPISIKLYTCGENPRNKEIPDFNIIKPDEVTEHIGQYLWTVLLAGIHKEHYRRNGKKEDLYFREYSFHNRRKGDCFSNFPLNLIRVDQYAISHHYKDVFIIHLESVFMRYGVASQLHLIISMLRHNSKIIDDHLDEVGGMVWNRLMSLLKGDGRYDIVDPATIYDIYINSQMNLKSEEDYLTVIQNQLYRYLAHFSYMQDTSKGVAIYTLENIKSVQGECYKPQFRGYRAIEGYYPIAFTMLTEKSAYLGYKRDNLLGIEAKYTKGGQYLPPDVSFNLEEYKEIIKSEYDLIPEIRELTDKQWWSPNHTWSEDPWTMVIFNDYVVGFYLGTVLSSSKRYSCTHEYITLNRNKLLIKSPYYTTFSEDTLCQVSEKDFKDPEFKEKYPKLCAMYERSYKLYHEYAAHGEKNPMAEQLSAITATLHSY